jgi:hypothetical protein
VLGFSKGVCAFSRPLEPREAPDAKLLRSYLESETVALGHLDDTTPILSFVPPLFLEFFTQKSYAPHRRPMALD